MRQAIAVRHVAFEDLDTFERALAADFSVAYRDAPVDDLAAPALEEAALLIVLGGPIGAYEDAAYPFLRRELALIERRLRQQKPVLGICLGAQLMARALGARVYPGTKELGWAPVALSAAGQRSCLAAIGEAPVLHWHGDTFDLPEGAELLASTPATAHQAFAWQRHGLALQFHVETSATGLERWYVGHTMEIAATRGVDVASLRAAGARHAPALAGPARAMLRNWLEKL